VLEVALNNRFGVVKNVTINPFVERARAWSERRSEREQAGHARWLHSGRLCCSWAQLELTKNPSAYSRDSLPVLMSLSSRQISGEIAAHTGHAPKKDNCK